MKSWRNAVRTREMHFVFIILETKEGQIFLFAINRSFRRFQHASVDFSRMKGKAKQILLRNFTGTVHDIEYQSSLKERKKEVIITVPNAIILNPMMASKHWKT